MLFAVAQLKPFFSTIFAVLAGRTDPFDQQTLERLYPGGRAEYLERFAASLDATIAAGFLRPEDRAEILALAEASYDALS